MSPQLLALALLPLSLALNSNSNSLAARQARHKALASKASLPTLDLDNNDVHPVLGKRSLEVRAGSGVNPGGFEVVGDSGVSAQMMFVGSAGVVYILDKTENNAMQYTSPSGAKRPAWGASYNVNTNVATPMGVTSNTFCAGGMSTANGSWVVYGGNQPVTVNGSAVNDKWANPSGANPYGNTDGGEAIRLLNPCDDGNCAWQEGTAALTMTSKRWYPTIEALGDGTHIILGGDNNGGYVSTFAQNNPTYEFWPKKGAQIRMDFLNATVPMNLFPLTWLMPSGKLFLQAGYSTILYDIPSQTEIPLPDMPYAQRIYPASGASVMLPLTPANNYNPTLLFCGGSDADLRKSSDGGSGFNVTAIPADSTCVRITPEGDATYSDDDDLPEGRSMGNLIYLPDGKLWLGNGVGMGTAGYGDDHWSFGQSYGQAPIYMPAVYDPNAPKGQRFSRQGLSASQHERMYHSTAVLLADGSLLVSGSNPNKDVTTVKWGTSYVVERWYPTWYSQTRPKPTSSWPASLSYGGDAWNLTYTGSTTSDPSNTKIVVIRTGFSTHGMNFGQRYLELGTSFTQYKDTGDVVMHVSQMPPNANIFQPGPAMIFLVVDGIPSTGAMIMIGSGQMETQTMGKASTLPGSTVLVNHATSSGSGLTSNAGSGASSVSGATSGNGTTTAANSTTSHKSAANMTVGRVSAVFAGMMGLLACAGAAML